MRKRVWLSGLAVIFVVSLSGCSTTGKSKDLEIQGLRTQVSALESQTPARTEDINSLDQTALSSSSTTGNLEGSAEVKDKPSARQIQAALKNAGYYQGVIDGKFGRKTRQAVKDFQKANNLSVDGKVGKKTWAALKEYIQKKVK